MNPISDPGALPHQECTTMEKLPATTSIRIRDPDPRKEIYSQQLSELSCVDRIRFGPGLPYELNLPGIGDAHFVSRALEMIVQPLPVESGFHSNSHRGREPAEEFAKYIE